MSLYQVKLLAALRSGESVPSRTHPRILTWLAGDPALIHPFIAEIGKEKRKAGPGHSTNDLDTAAAALHLAVRCASGQSVISYQAHRSYVWQSTQSPFSYPIAPFPQTACTRPALARPPSISQLPSVAQTS